MDKTINYFLFKHIESNRPVDESHVKRLITAITKKDLLHLNPIIVNNKMEVVDGQHRLEAAKRLGKYIHYVVDESVNKMDIATINSNSKNWGILDYINYWEKEKAPGFDVLCRFMEENPFISPSVAIRLISSKEVRSHDDLRSGIIDVGNLEKANMIGGVLKEYSELFKHTYDQKFILAVERCFNIPGYDHDIMRRKVSFQPRSLVKCINTQQYLDMLDEIYNYGASKNRLTFK